MDANSMTPVTDVVDDAGGMGKSYWFVAIVNCNSEKQTSEKLTEIGISNYLPVQSEVRVWRNGRKSKVDRIVIPSIIFIHCTEQQRRDIVKLPFINRFMTDKARNSDDLAGRPIARVSEKEIRQLQFMLGQSDVPVNVVPYTYRSGDRVRVVRGGLAGLEGEVTDMKSSQTEVIVRLRTFGCAKMMIDIVNLEHADTNKPIKQAP